MNFEGTLYQIKVNLKAADFDIFPKPITFQLRHDLSMNENELVLLSYEFNDVQSIKMHRYISKGPV